MILDKDLFQIDTKLTDLAKRKRRYIDYGEGSHFKNVTAIKIEKPTFFEEVNKCLTILGRLTLKGDSNTDRLDELKTTAFELIKL